ncbi:MAG: hypothetical protein AB1Z98_33770 [Nannocystaceae bacterium]
MKRLAGGLVVASLVASTGSGCAREQEALIVLYSVAPTVDPMSSGCLYEEDTDIRIASGLLDVSAGDPYVLAPLLLNNLPSRAANANNSGVDDSELQLTSTVDITLRVPSAVARERGTGADGRAVPLSYEASIATDSLPPGDMYVTRFDAIPAELAVSLAAAIAPGESVDVVAEIEFHATRTGNSRGRVGVIDSRVYEFPITLCNGCMVTRCECSADDVCIAGTEEAHELVCGRAQDVYLSESYCEAIADGLPPALTTGPDETTATTSDSPPLTTDTGDATDTSDGPPATSGPPGGTG